MEGELTGFFLCLDAMSQGMRNDRPQQKATAAAHISIWNSMILAGIFTEGLNCPKINHSLKIYIYTINHISHRNDLSYCVQYRTKKGQMNATSIPLNLNSVCVLVE